MPVVKFSNQQEKNDDHLGYVTKCKTFAAIPYSNGQYIIINNGQQVHLAKSLTTAKSYINRELRKLQK